MVSIGRDPWRMFGPTPKRGKPKKKNYLPVSLTRYTQEIASVVVFSIFAHYYSPDV